MSYTATNNGIGITGILTIIFVVLKLIPEDHGHIIDWSWWWVLSPLWISLLLAVGVVLFILLALVIATMIKSKRQ